MKYFGFGKVVVVDNVPSRLEEAKRLGATKVINFETEPDGIKKYITEETDGVGFDAVLEVVGSAAAIKHHLTPFEEMGLFRRLEWATNHSHLMD